MRGGIAKGKCSKVMLEAVAARVIQLGVSCANDMMKIRLVPASPLAEKECMAHPCVGSYPPAHLCLKKTLENPVVHPSYLGQFQLGSKAMPGRSN